MGCDIHLADYQDFFKNRDYSVFAFLAGVRNRDNIIPISPPRGLPEDLKCPEFEYQGGFDVGQNHERDHMVSLFGTDDLHNISWLTTEELVNFNYARPINSRLCINYKVYLGPWYFEELDRLVASGETRIVFGFDS